MSAEEQAPYGTVGPKRLRIHHLHEMKRRREKIAMLTSYDMYTAAIFDAAGIELLLVGDSASNNVYGNSTTIPITLNELVPLTRAVSRSVTRSIVVGDLPFGSYQASPEGAFESAARLMKEGGAHAVKLEGGRPMFQQIKRISDGGIPVMGHVGFTPQSEHLIGGYRIQGRGESAKRIVEDAVAVQEAGAFAVVLEMVPASVAEEVSQLLSIPTIGIGAGGACDGQVLVWQDAFGMRTERLPKFVKTYARLHDILMRAARNYAGEVKSGVFPSAENEYD